MPKPKRKIDVYISAVDDPRVARRVEERVARVRRGERVAQIRNALDLTGDEFALLIARHLQAVGSPRRYDKAEVARIEGGARGISPEELAIIATLDPARRSLLWLVFGDVAGA